MQVCSPSEKKSIDKMIDSGPQLAGIMEYNVVLSEYLMWDLHSISTCEELSFPSTGQDCSYTNTICSCLCLNCKFCGYYQYFYYHYTVQLLLFNVIILSKCRVFIQTRQYKASLEYCLGFTLIWQNSKSTIQTEDLKPNYTVKQD